MDDLRCTHPVYEASRSNPSGDCRRPAVAWAPLPGERATIARLVCAEHRDRYQFTRPLDSLPEDP